jgi:hypothetical protein
MRALPFSKADRERFLSGSGRKEEIIGEDETCPRHVAASVETARTKSWSLKFQV